MKSMGLAKPLTQDELRRAASVLQAIKEPLQWAPPQVASKVYRRALEWATGERRDERT